MTADQATADLGGYHDLVRRDVFGLVPERAGRLLDLGGGVGATALALKQAGRAERAVVADLVADTALAGLDAAYGGDLENPEFLQRIIAEQGPFDTVLCLDVLEHLSDPWSVVATLAGGLAPGGAIVASLPNASNIRLVWPLVVHGRFDLTEAGICDRTHLRWFVRQTAVDLLTGPGLRLEAVEGKLLAGRRYRLTNAATFGLLRRFFEIQYLIRVRAPE